MADKQRRERVAGRSKKHALLRNAEFLATSNPTREQIENHIRFLTQQVNALTSLATGSTKQYLLPGYVDPAPEEGPHE